jgi:hypothetical protein
VPPLAFGCAAAGAPGSASAGNAGTALISAFGCAADSAAGSAPGSAAGVAPAATTAPVAAASTVALAAEITGATGVLEGGGGAGGDCLPACGKCLPPVRGSLALLAPFFWTGLRRASLRAPAKSWVGPVGGEFARGPLSCVASLLACAWKTGGVAFIRVKMQGTCQSRAAVFIAAARTRSSNRRGRSCLCGRRPAG